MREVNFTLRTNVLMPFMLAMMLSWMILAVVLIEIPALRSVYFVLPRYYGAFQNPTRSENCPKNLLTNFKTRSEVLAPGDMNVIFPDKRCAWIKAPFLPKPGVGHAASALNYLILMSKKYSLTLFTDFGPSGHGQSATETSNYFGFGCLLSSERFPSLNATVIPVTFQNFEFEYKKNRGILSCSRGDTIFDLGGRVPNFPVDCNYNTTKQLFRTMFELSYNSSHGPNNKGKLERLRYLPEAVREAKVARDVVIAVHVRRGDIQDAFLQSGPSDIWGRRYVPFEVQKYGIHQILLAKSVAEKQLAAQYGNRPTRGIKLLFVTEDATNHELITDYDSSSHSFQPLNITSALWDICNSSNQCSSFVFTDDSTTMLHSFTAFCESDVIFATVSQFSHLASELCSTPKLTLATPFFCPFSGQNVVNIVPGEFEYGRPYADPLLHLAMIRPMRTILSSWYGTADANLPNISETTPPTATVQLPLTMTNKTNLNISSTSSQLRPKQISKSLSENVTSTTPANKTATAVRVTNSTTIHKRLALKSKHLR